MVNFNDGQTVVSPIPNVTKLLILEKRENYIIGQESFDRLGNNTSETLFLTIKSRLLALFWELEPHLYKRLDNDEYEQLVKLTNSDHEEEIKTAWKFINRFIYQLGVTYVDTKPFVKNYGRVEEVHKAHHV